jgi:subtilisin family serine protease
MKVFARLTVAGVLLLAACSDQIPSTAATSAIASVGGLRLAKTAAGDEIVAGQILVRYRDTESAASNRDAIPGRHRGKKKAEMLLPRTEIIEVAEGEELAVIASLRDDPDVEWAEPDFVARVGPCEVSTACSMPDGAFFDYKWDLRNTGSWTNTIPNFAPVGSPVVTGKPDADIDWVELYDYLGSNYAGSAVVGILDTGIRPTHTLFAGKIIGGHRFLPDTTTIAGGASNFTDDHGHGSHVAGLAAGRAISPTPAVAGVAYGANIKILMGKVCNSGGTCPSSSTANGIVWMADNGANVINLSLGGFGSNPDGTGSAAQQAALQYALSKNVLALCATGNDDGKPTYTGNIGYPARFPECFAVAATDWGDTKTSYSNYGPETDISAPGGDGERSPFSLIPSASRNGDNTYAWNAGTSMATPEVTGLAALLYAQGYTTAAAVRQRIIETADDVEAPGWDPRTGHGRINAYRAITGLNPNEPPVADPGAGYSGNKGVAVQFTGAGSNDPNGKPITFAWDFGDPASASNTSSEQNPSHTYMRAGNYTVSLTVTDAANLSATSNRVAVIPNIVPAVSFAGTTILQGETYATSGSFADADPDSWTASVGYGDGSESEGLALSAAKGFALSHRYMAAGAHTVAVSVSDDDGGNGGSSATVTVWTPQQGIQELLLNQIDARLALISAQQAAVDAEGIMNSLGAKGRAAIAALDRGQGNTAENQLGAFINHLEALAKSGKVPAATASEWTATVYRIIASINR